MSEPYSTQDLYEAAACPVQGHAVTVVRLPNGRNRFDFPSGAAETARAYGMGLTAPLLFYANALRSLKKQMYTASTNQPTNEVHTNVSFGPNP